MADQVQRAHPRYAVEIDAEFRGDFGKVAARTRDISSGGMACWANAPLVAGTEPEVALSLVFSEKEFSEPLVLRARIVWSTPMGNGKHQLGCAFTGMNRDSRQYLEMFLRYLQEGLDAQADASGDDDDHDDGTGADDEKIFG